MNNNSYPTWVEVNLSAIIHNTHLVIQSTGVALMSVVKANAYGHGIIEVAKATLEGGATWLGVARLNEAFKLRDAGITAPILAMGAATPNEIDQAIGRDVTITLHSAEVADLFIERAKAIGKPVNAHMKVETGLGRLGMMPEEILPIAQKAIQSGWVNLDGVFSHFAMADIKDHPLTPLQIKRFKQVVDELHAAGIRPKWLHLCNSAGALAYPEAKFNLVRAGSAVIGVNPFEGSRMPTSLRTSLTWKAWLVSCKVLPKGWGISYGQQYTTTSDEIIGVVPVGYGDGFRRFSNNEVLIDGQRVPVVGRVCMDQCMVRLPRRYPLGTEVVLLGKQGNETITADDLAVRWNTTLVDVCAILAQRVERVYVRD